MFHMYTTGYTGFVTSITSIQGPSLQIAKYPVVQVGLHIAMAPLLLWTVGTETKLNIDHPHPSILLDRGSKHPDLCMLAEKYSAH